MSSEGSGIGCVVAGIVVLLFFMVSCASCGGSSSSRSSSGMSEADFSERAQKLGRSTKEYRDAFNYWYYQKP